MNTNTIDYIGFERILKRGTGQVIEEGERALFLYDAFSEVYLLACEDQKEGMAILDRHMDEDCDVLMVANPEVGEAARRKFGFRGTMDCVQFVFCGESVDCDETVTTKVADLGHLPMLLANYDLVSPEELHKVVASGNVLLGYAGNELIGFIGEHLEGSMGMLHIFPEHRRHGYASSLEKKLIQRTLDRGFTPFGHVVKDNGASIELQKKLGLQQADRGVCWLWR